MNTCSSVNEIENSSAFPDKGESLSAGPDKTRSVNWQKLTKILRWTGAILLLASTFIFLCQGLAGLSSMEKYRTFLGFTALLGGVGIFCGKKWKEDKGARTFLGLATAMVAANFAQLAAFLFYQFKGSPEFLPNFFVLQFSNTGSLFLTCAIAVCILFPVSFFGFSALIRKQAVPLSTAYLLCCSCLLLPSRAELAMAGVLLFQTATLLILEAKKLRQETHMSTFDGWLVRGILLLPVFIVAFRTILYPIDYLFYSTGLAVLGTTLFFFLPDHITSETGKRVCNILSMLCFGGSWLLMINGLSSDLLWLQDYGLLVNFLPCAALIIVFSFINPEDGSQKRVIGALLALAACLMQLFPAGDFLSAFICLIVSATLVVLGCVMEEKIPLLAGTAGAIAGLGKYIHYALQYYSLAPWLSLAIAGALVVLLSSYLEKYRHRDLGRLQNLHQRLKTWN